MQHPGLALGQGLQGRGHLLQPRLQVAHQETGAAALGQGGQDTRSRAACGLAATCQAHQFFEAGSQAVQVHEHAGLGSLFQALRQLGTAGLGEQHGAGNPLEAPAPVFQVQAQAVGPGALQVGMGFQITSRILPRLAITSLVEEEGRLGPAPLEGHGSPLVHGPGAEIPEGRAAVLAAGHAAQGLDHLLV